MPHRIAAGLWTPRIKHLFCRLVVALFTGLLAGCDPSVMTQSIPACRAVSCIAVPQPEAAGIDSSLVVSWPPVKSATSYNVYYSTSSGVTPTTGTAMHGVQPGVTIGSLSNGTPYYAIVSTSVGAEEGQASAAVSGTPQAPGGQDNPSAEARG